METNMTGSFNQGLSRGPMRPRPNRRPPGGLGGSVTPPVGKGPAPTQPPLNGGMPLVPGNPPAPPPNSYGPQPGNPPASPPNAYGPQPGNPPGQPPNQTMNSGGMPLVPGTPPSQPPVSFGGPNGGLMPGNPPGQPPVSYGGPGGGLMPGTPPVLPPAPTPDIASVNTPVDPAAIAAYWTPERMTSAQAPGMGAVQGGVGGGMQPPNQTMNYGGGLAPSAQPPVSYGGPNGGLMPGNPPAPPPNSYGPQPGNPPMGMGAASTNTPVDPAAIAAYWTPERMGSAGVLGMGVPQGNPNGGMPLVPGNPPAPPPNYYGPQPGNPPQMPWWSQGFSGSFNSGPFYNNPYAPNGGYYS